MEKSSKRWERSRWNRKYKWTWHWVTQKNPKMSLIRHSFDTPLVIELEYFHSKHIIRWNYSLCQKGTSCGPVVDRGRDLISKNSVLEILKKNSFPSPIFFLKRILLRVWLHFVFVCFVSCEMSSIFFNGLLSLCVCVWVCVCACGCVCACIWEREREWER